MFISGGMKMKNILSQIHPSSKLTAIIGGIAVLAVVAISAVLYFGAGSIWDYYSSVAISEKLLTLSRPLSVLVCCLSLWLEYRARKR